MSLKPDKLFHSGRLIKRLMAYTIITDDNHWLWKGKRNKKGHGKIKIGGRKGREVSVSRLSAFIHLGLNLKDEWQQALHKTSCPYKNCWNPSCLYVGTHQDNMNDKKILNQLRKLTVNQGAN